MLPNDVKTDVFQILLRYAAAAKHDLNAKHAATATGVGNSTAFAKIANAKAEAKVNTTHQIAPGPEAFQALLAYAEASGHKLSAIHAAAATGIGKSTAFAKIAAARRAFEGGATKKPSSATPTPEKTAGRKRKASTAIDDVDAPATKIKKISHKSQNVKKEHEAAIGSTNDTKTKADPLPTKAKPKKPSNKKNPVKKEKLAAATFEVATENIPAEDEAQETATKPAHPSIKSHFAVTKQDITARAYELGIKNAKALEDKYKDPPIPAPQPQEIAEETTEGEEAEEERTIVKSKEIPEHYVA